MVRHSQRSEMTETLQDSTRQAVHWKNEKAMMRWSDETVECALGEGDKWHSFANAKLGSQANFVGKGELPVSHASCRSVQREYARRVF